MSCVAFPNFTIADAGFAAPPQPHPASVATGAPHAVAQPQGFAVPAQQAAFAPSTFEPFGAQQLYLVPTTAPWETPAPVTEPQSVFGTATYGFQAPPTGAGSAPATPLWVLANSPDGSAHMVQVSGPLTGARLPEAAAHPPSTRSSSASASSTPGLPAQSPPKPAREHATPLSRLGAAGTQFIRGFTDCPELRNALAEQNAMCAAVVEAAVWTARDFRVVANAFAAIDGVVRRNEPSAVNNARRGGRSAGINDASVHALILDAEPTALAVATARYIADCGSAAAFRACADDAVFRELTECRGRVTIALIDVLVSAAAAGSLAAESALSGAIATIAAHARDVATSGRGDQTLIRVLSCIFARGEDVTALVAGVGRAASALLGHTRALFSLGHFVLATCDASSASGRSSPLLGLSPPRRALAQAFARAEYVTDIPTFFTRKGDARDGGQCESEVFARFQDQVLEALERRASVVLQGRQHCTVLWHAFSRWPEASRHPAGLRLLESIARDHRDAAASPIAALARSTVGRCALVAIIGNHLVPPLKGSATAQVDAAVVPIAQRWVQAARAVFPGGNVPAIDTAQEEGLRRRAGMEAAHALPATIGQLLEAAQIL